MKTIATLAALALVSLLGHPAHAAPQSPAATLSQAEQDYCHAYAESEYQAAVKAGNGLPDASYEGAAEECELQWQIVETQWHGNNDLDEMALGIPETE